jgi:hypothetical protein
VPGSTNPQLGLQAVVELSNRDLSHESMIALQSPDESSLLEFEKGSQIARFT